nr:hypothetical protein [Rhizobium sp. 007]
MIGRKLNVRLAELRMNSKEVMSTKEQLQKLFEHERDSMLAHLENVATAARRNGRPAEIEELELDLENGWAYKLLAMYGIRHRLTLADGCNGQTFLLVNGVPASHIDAIRSNYFEQLHVANSRVFQDGIRALMQQFGIDAHPLNHEKAMKAYFGGRAEALLDVDDRHPLADRSLSEFMGGSRLNHQPTASTSTQAGQPPIAPHTSAIAPVSLAPEPPAIVTLDLQSAPRPVVPEHGDVSKGRPVIPIANFEVECEQLVKNMKEAWDESTARGSL